MSREDFVAVAARLFAIYLLLNIVKSVPGAMQLFSQEQDITWFALFAVILVLGLFACVFLWFFPLTIARKILPVMREPRSDKSIDSSIALSLGLTLIGVWILAYGLVDGVYWLTLFVRTQQMDTTYFEWSHEQIAGMFSTVFELALAVLLIFGNSGLRRLIYKYRYGES